MREQVHIRVLGAFEVRVAGTFIRAGDWKHRRAMELVQLLSLAPGHAVVRDRVIDALWPHLGMDAGAANLRKAAHHARRTLGRPDAVVLRSGRVMLFPGVEVGTDLERFRQAATAALRSPERPACLGAADLVTGPLLPGSLYEEWTQADRRQVDGLLASLLRTAGAWERLVQLDPTDEEAHRELMVQALDAGSASEAVRRFEVLREALSTELGVTPDPRTTAVYERAVSLMSTSATELIGRDAELAVVASAGRPGTSGEVRMIAVTGPAGIGTSAFCREAAVVLREQGRAVFRAAAGRHGRPYGPLIGLFEELLADPADPLAGAPEPVRAVIGALTGRVGDAPPLGGPVSRHQVIGALIHALRLAGDGRSPVLVLDDAHRADTGTLDVLVHALGSGSDLTVIAAFRAEAAPEPLWTGLARLDRAGHVVRLALEGLDPGAATALVRRAALRPLTDGTVTRIVERAEGNPFTLIELARAATSGDDRLPPSLGEAIIGRLADLDPRCGPALERLALSADDLDAGLAAALTGGTEEEALGVLDDVLRAGVLVVARGRYRFRHELVRQAFRERIPPHRRRVVHRHAALRLTELGAPSGLIAHHWLGARDHANALPWCLQAAREAMALGAFSDARRHLAPVLDHEAGNAEALALEAECLDMLGEPSALDAYDAAIRVATDDSVGDLLAAKALAQVKQGDPAGGLTTISGPRPRSFAGRLNEALTYAGAAALGAADPAMGSARAAEVRRLALRAGDRAGVVIAAWAHAAAAHARGELHDSVLRDLRDTGDLPHLAVRVFDGHLCMTQRFLYGSRPYGEVIGFATALAEEARRLGARRGQAFGITLRAEARFLSGDLDGAYGDFDAGLGLHRGTGGPTGEAHALQRLAELQFAHGRFRDARSTIAEALELARISDIGFHLLDRIYGSLITINDDPDEALSAVEEAEAAVKGPLETCPGCRIHLVVPAAIAAARAGDLPRARRYATDADYLTNVVMRLPGWYAAYDEVLANLALAEGDRIRAGALFRSAVTRYQDIGQIIDADRCRAAL